TRLVKSSNFKEYRATVLVETSINKLVNFITDGNKLKDWNYRTTKSSLIEKISDSIFLYTCIMIYLGLLKTEIIFLG
ncbi:hypothetical protein OAX11_04905, partial [Flavobacteriaceae bacterium]|nr:hypothetical protein [Flavobacteriaceae bacterium]